MSQEGQLRAVGPLSIPHLAARSGSPAATTLRPSLAAAGAWELRAVGPLSIPHLAARSGSPAATTLRPSLAAADAWELRSVRPFNSSLAVRSGSPYNDYPPALACSRGRLGTSRAWSERRDYREADCV